MACNKATWTPFADDVIEARYPEGGADACLPLLPGRTKAAIMQRAFKLGIRTRLNPALKDESEWALSDQAPAHRAWQEVDRRMSSTPAANGPRYLIGAMG